MEKEAAARGRVMQAGRRRRRLGKGKGRMETREEREDTGGWRLRREKRGEDGD